MRKQKFLKKESFCTSPRKRKRHQKLFEINWVQQEGNRGEIEQIGTN